MKKWLAIIGVLGCVSVAPANAAVIFSDNFNAENGGVPVLNYNSFANFNVVSGTVDLIGNTGAGFGTLGLSSPPGFDFLPGHGLYVDLDGSTGDAGMVFSQTDGPLSVLNPLGAGEWMLGFKLAGSQRGSTETVEVRVFDTGDITSILNIGTFTVTSAQGFTDYFLPFTITGAPRAISFAFQNFGAPGDNVGALLDDVSVSTPEPGSMFLLGTGLLGLAKVGRRRFGLKRESK